MAKRATMIKATNNKRFTNVPPAPRADTVLKGRSHIKNPARILRQKGRSHLAELSVRDPSQIGDQMCCFRDVSSPYHGHDQLEVHLFMSFGQGVNFRERQLREIHHSA